MNLVSFGRKNIIKTGALFLGFFIFVVGFGYFFSYIFGSANILYFAVIFSASMSFISYWFSDKIILAMSKAKSVSPQSSPEIYGIIRNLCQKAGLPPPRIYIIEERQPNAFATGRDEKHAAVALTRGLLEKLNKEEVEGVLGHEISHIKNKDMLIATFVVVLVGFVAILSRMFLWSSILGGRKNSQERGLLPLVGLLLSVLAPLSAMLIQLAISRKRELLADASGALLTRNPEGLAMALEKISSDRTPMMAAQEATSHLFIANPFKGEELIKLFMSHPPIEERIKALREMNI
ncbi:MAG: M48 family metalloprotease [Candidatus Nealsonbacteria bacterium]|nr:M48 family metalloprotease [Candidatus Nealsonbacteria bacterium]